MNKINIPENISWVGNNQSSLWTGNNIPNPNAHIINPNQPQVTQTVAAPPIPGKIDSRGYFVPAGFEEERIWQVFRVAGSQIIRHYESLGVPETFVREKLMEAYQANPNIDDRTFWLVFEKIYLNNKEYFAQLKKRTEEARKLIEEQNKQNPERCGVAQDEDNGLEGVTAKFEDKQAQKAEMELKSTQKVLRSLLEEKALTQGLDSDEQELLNDLQ